MVQELLNIKDFEQTAGRLLDSSVFDFFYGGANDEISLKENESSYSKLKLIPKVLNGIQNIDTTISLFGNTLNVPILIAPMAFQRLAHLGGEIETAKAARLLNTIMIVSAYSTCLYKDIISTLSLPPWLQIYILKDREITKGIIQLAESIGYGALVITVDAPIYGKRERELKNPINSEVFLPDLSAIIQKIRPNLELKHIKDLSNFLEPSISWQDIEWVSSCTKLPIILKGILRAEDARIAASHGIAGIIVSNHGGRQLDTAIPAICALPKIREVVSDKLEILLDGGISRGTDVLKSLALGARAVLVGRPIIWGLAVNGSVGVCKILELLNEELKMAMILCGCGKIDDITDELIFK